MTGQKFSLSGLARVSFARPEDGARAMMALRLSMAERWMLLVASVVVSVLVVYLPPLMSGNLDGLFPPLAMTAQHLGSNILAAALLAFGGQMFGGHGRFGDAVLLLGWLQALTVPFLVLQVVLDLIAPGVVYPVVFLSIFLFFWLLTGFVAGMHGFTSRIAVLVGLVFGAFAVGVVLSILLLGLGIEFPGMNNV